MRSFSLLYFLEGGLNLIGAFCASACSSSEQIFVENMRYLLQICDIQLRGFLLACLIVAFESIIFWWTALYSHTCLQNNNFTRIKASTGKKTRRITLESLRD